MKEQMRVELHNETEYTQCISFRTIWTNARNLKHTSGCRAAAITDRNSVYGMHTAERFFTQEDIQLIYGVTLNCIDTDDRYDVVLLATNLTGRDNIFRLIELLESNQFSFGRAVTREQLDAHREGVLLGAAAKDGQVIRAIQHRRDYRYLETIARNYDYLEFTSEPYDIAALLAQLATEENLPLCAVQYAVLSEPDIPLEKYAYLTLCRYFGQEADAQYFKTPEQLQEEIENLYVLPAEKMVCQKVLYDDPQRVISRIEPMPTLEELLDTTDATFHAVRMTELRDRVCGAIQENYGAHCPAQVSDRVQWELAEIDAQKQAHVILFLADMTKQAQHEGERMMLAGEAANSEILYLLGVTEFDPLPRHMYCKECGLWLETQAEIGESIDCPNCGQKAAVSGLNVPVEAIHTFLINHVCFEVRASTECILSFKQESEKATYVILQTPPRDPLPIEVDMDALCKTAAEIGAEEWCREREFTYRLISHLPRNQDSGTLQKWLLPGVSTPDFIQHLPARRIAGNTYQLALQPDHTVACSGVSLIASDALSFLAACEKSTGISASEISHSAQDIFAQIRATLLGEMVPSEASAYALRISGFGQQELFEDNDRNPRIQAIVRKMPLECFSDLMRIFLIKHGTGTWTGNAEDILDARAITVKQVITCREDVMEYLTAHGVERKLAYEMMTAVRNGRACTLWDVNNSSAKAKQQQQLLRDCGAEEWFIESCKKIKYLFPRAHAASFAANLIRMMWYCIHEPECTERILKEQQI